MNIRILCAVPDKVLRCSELKGKKSRKTIKKRLGERFENGKEIKKGVAFRVIRDFYGFWMTKLHSQGVQCDKVGVLKLQCLKC